MATNKYGKHILKADITAKPGEAPALRFNAGDYGVDAGWVFIPVTKAAETKTEGFQIKPHSHDFDQFISVTGSDPKDIRKMDAKIAVGLGEKLETHVIDSPTIL